VRASVERGRLHGGRARPRRTPTPPSGRSTPSRQPGCAPRCDLGQDDRRHRGPPLRGPSRACAGSSATPWPARTMTCAGWLWRCSSD